MKIDIVKLSLPAPSDKLVGLLTKYVHSLELNPDSKRWLDEFHDNKINSALHFFSRPGIVPEEIDLQLRAEYQQYFPKHIISTITGVMDSDGTGPATQPAHADRGRSLALAYYIKSGGTAVTTVFYDMVKEIVGEAHNVPYDQITAAKSVIFPTLSWFAYPVDRVHSVDNITSLRYFLGIRLKRLTHENYDYNYSVTDLVNDYPNLIEDYL
jgi:hypothetical protein